MPTRSVSDDFWSRSELLRAQARDDLETLGLKLDKPINEPGALLQELRRTGVGIPERWGEPDSVLWPG